MRTRLPFRLWVEHQLGALSLAAYNKPARALTAAALVTAVMAFFGSRLSLVADLTELLPESFPSVQDLHVVKERFGGIGYVVVVGMDAEPEGLRRFADDAARKLEGLASVRHVEYRRPAAFFEDRLLYFLPTDDLRTIADRVKTRYEWERAQRNPFLVDLEAAKPPPLDFSDIERSQSGRADQRWMQSQLGEPYYLDPHKRIVALLAKPASPAMELAVAQEVVADVKAAVAELSLASYGPDFKVDYTGRYTRAVDQQALIKHDLKLSSALSMGLVMLFLWFHFRRILTVALILTPLCVGLAWTYGAAQLIFGNLNILTGFIGAILLGLGIDHGIHLMSRFQAERGSGGAIEDAVRSTFGNTGRAVAVAALTTAVGFAGLGLSEFRAFHEFGIISALGMILTVCAFVVISPALIAVATSLGWTPKTDLGGVGASTFARRLRGWARPLLVVSVLALVAAVSHITKARFNYDFRALEANHLPSFTLDEDTNKLLGYSQSPVVVLTEGLEEERAVAAALRARQAEHGERTTIDFAVATTDLIPLDQQRKHEILQDLDKIVTKVKPGWLAPEYRPNLPAVKRMTKAEPFTMDDLPLEVRRQFQGISEAKESGFVLVFPSISLSVGSEVSRFAKEVRGVPLPDGRRVSAAGEDMILADIFDMVTREAPPVLFLTLVLITATLWLLLGTVRQTLLSLAPAAATLAAALGLLQPLGLELNYLNIVVIPVLFGIGVDGAAHILTRVHAGMTVSEVLDETGRAICGSVATTALGFGALLVADHPGLDSIGELAILGLAINTLASLVVVPAWLAWRAGSTTAEVAPVPQVTVVGRGQSEAAAADSAPTRARPF